MSIRQKIEVVLSGGKRHAMSGENNSDFLSKVTRTYHMDFQADYHNMEPGREDMQFVIGDQWEENARRRRNHQKKPVITVNRLPAFVAQYMGSYLQSDTTIKVSPTSAGSKKTAEIRQGIIRTIMRTNTAKLARNKAAEGQYICGVGNFALEVVDAENDVFLRDIKMKTLADPFQVVWDRASKDPTGADAQHCFVFDWMTREDFKKTYPDNAEDSGWSPNDIDSTVMTGHGWEVDEMVRICYFYQMKREEITLGLERDTGDVIDVSDMSKDEIMSKVEFDDDGDPIVRETTTPYCEVHIITSDNVLEGPQRLNISRLPVFRSEGWALTQASVRFRWGFIRNAKDPQRIHNFWRSTLASELMKSTAGTWLLDIAGAKNGLADKFRKAHRDGDNVLTWDSQADGAKPEMIPPPPLNQAVLTEAEMTVRDIRDVTNRHEASMGQASNEVSGKAINARQRVSELGDVVYTDNHNMALAEAGRVINELIPAVYDTARTVKVTGEDDAESLQAINGDMGDATPDVTLGKYAITYSTGPSYATKRQESVDVILTLMNTMPSVGNMVADILVRNMDIPGADEIEERLAYMLPEGMLNLDKVSEERKERILKQQEAQKQAQNQQMAMQMAQFQEELNKLRAEVAESGSRARKNDAQAMVAASEVGVSAAEVDVKQDKAIIDAAKAGAVIDQQGIDMFQHGLTLAAGVASEKKEDQNAQTNNTQGGDGSGAQATDQGSPVG